MPHIYPEGCVFNSLADIKDKHVTIMGLGLNGGGLACVRFFLKQGAFVTVTDMKSAEQLKTTIDKISEDKTLDHSRLTYVLGEHRMEDFQNADCVIKNPGVKIEGNKFLAQAKAIETDLSIFLHFTKAPIIAVTGSKGKSSTVSAIYHGLRESGFKTFLGGNITVSPLTFLDQTDGTTPVVLELSSWQLSDLRGRKALKPKIAVITKIVPDHQNWYGAMAPYVDDKKLIYADQGPQDFTILDLDQDGYLHETSKPVPGCTCWGDVFAKETKAKVLRYSTQRLPSNVMGVFQAIDRNKKNAGYLQLSKDLLHPQEKDTSAPVQIMGPLSVPGSHMKINVLNAALVLYLMGVSPQQALTVLGAWHGIPHRLENFHRYTAKSGRTFNFYNDSAATVPQACAAASQSFEKPVVLLAGGTDKQLDFHILADTVASRESDHFKPTRIYLLSGSGTDKLVPLLQLKGVHYEGPFDSLENLLTTLKKELSEIEVITKYKDAIPIVFSPGATSFGMFLNEFDRGNKFKAMVEKIFN